MSINEHDRDRVEAFIVQEVTPLVDRFCVELESDALSAFSSDVVLASSLNPFTLAKVKKRWTKVVDGVQATTKRMFKDQSIDLTPIWQMLDSMDLPSTLHQRVSRMLETGVNEGWSKQKMADHLQKITGNPTLIIGGLAVGLATIVTATVALRAMRKNKVQYKKWKSLHDSRVRDAHAEADGQIQLADEPFTVGGALLRYPGDPAGPPGQVINCRCIVVGTNRDGEPIKLASGDSSITDYLILSP